MYTVPLHPPLYGLLDFHLRYATPPSFTVVHLPVHHVPYLLQHANLELPEVLKEHVDLASEII